MSPSILPVIGVANKSGVLLLFRFGEEPNYLSGYHFSDGRGIGAWSVGKRNTDRNARTRSKLLGFGKSEDKRGGRSRIC